MSDPDDSDAGFLRTVELVRQINAGEIKTIATSDLNGLMDTLRKKRAEIERLQSVVDAAREVVEIRSCTNRLRKALRALDGEP